MAHGLVFMKNKSNKLFIKIDNLDKDFINYQENVFALKRGYDEARKNKFKFINYCSVL